MYNVVLERPITWHNVKAVVIATCKYTAFMITVARDRLAAFIRGGGSDGVEAIEKGCCTHKARASALGGGCSVSKTHGGA